MNKLGKAIIAVFTLLIIAVICLSVYVLVNKIPYLKSENQRLTQEVKALEQVIEIKDWQYGAKVIKNKTLKNKVDLKDQEITELKMDQLAFEDAVDIIEYCVTYIHVLQIRMDDKGVVYPNFILETILNDILTEQVTDD